MNLNRRRLLGGLGGLGGGLASALGAVGVSGCVAWPGQVASPWPGDGPEQVDLSPRTPFVAQDDSLCGPAALAMVLAAAGRPTPLATLTEQVYLPGRQGSLQLEMQAALRRHGVLAHRVEASLPGAMAELAQGTPVLVLLNLALPWWPRWHYAVVVGHDRARQSFWLHTGTRARDAWPWQTLDATWARSGHWGLLALPPGQLPARATASGVLAATLAFEHSQGALAALPAWQAGHARFADDLPLALGYGNGLLAAGQLQQAAEVLEALAQSSGSAAAWNNLAIVRARQGQKAASRAALDRAEAQARAREPAWLDEIARTRRELGA